MSLFRHGGKKAAGVAGDVSVDGRGKRVSRTMTWDLDRWLMVDWHQDRSSLVQGQSQG